MEYQNLYLEEKAKEVITLKINLQFNQIKTWVYMLTGRSYWHVP